MAKTSAVSPITLRLKAPRCSSTDNSIDSSQRRSIPRILFYKTSTTKHLRRTVNQDRRACVQKYIRSTKMYLTKPSGPWRKHREPNGRVWYAKKQTGRASKQENDVFEERLQMTVIGPAKLPRIRFFGRSLQKQADNLEPFQAQRLQDPNPGTRACQSQNLNPVEQATVEGTDPRPFASVPDTTRLFEPDDYHYLSALPAHLQQCPNTMCLTSTPTRRL
ncbi:hypothetical protein MMC20_003728 [Loxospora ochrophaea]|nr:hypothetical protein [Loxospora ochrophaea]